MAVYERDLADAASNLKDAKNKLSEVSHETNSPNSAAKLGKAQERLAECQGKFDRLYEQYRSEMEHAGQRPKAASYWPH